MEKFPKIGSVSQVRKLFGFLGEDPVVQYTPSVKLHGTNAGVHLSTEPVPQSRNRTLSIESDNHGFAQFVADRRREMALLEEIFGVGSTVYGELIGAGIQKKVAVAELDRQWVVFAARNAAGDWLRVPDFCYQEADIYSISAVKYDPIEINFASPLAFDRGIQDICTMVEQVESTCPWAQQFGVEGVGEGLVFTTKFSTGDREPHEFWFKAKGEKHSATRVKKISPSATDPRVYEFVESAVTPERLQQGLDYLEEMGHAVDMRSTSHFLKWVGNDVKEECDIELSNAGLEWPQVAKHVNFAAVRFFKQAAGGQP